MFRSHVLAFLLLAGCANQFEATYDPAGDWSYADMHGAPEGCTADFLAGLEAGVTLDGAFPAFASTDLTQGAITLLDETVAIEIEAADDLNTARGLPAEDAPLTFTDGTVWSLVDIHFETASSCASCEDQIVVELWTETESCEPWPVYQKN